MKPQSSLRVILSVAKGTFAQQQELFALLNLGLVQSLASGVINAIPGEMAHAIKDLYRE